MKSHLDGSLAYALSFFTGNVTRSLCLKTRNTHLVTICSKNALCSDTPGDMPGGRLPGAG